MPPSLPTPSFLFPDKECPEKSRQGYGTSRMFSQLGTLNGIKQTTCLPSLPPTPPFPDSHLFITLLVP